MHLIEPLGFSLDEKSCRRAGLDYKEMAKVKSWPDFNSYKSSQQKGKLWLITKFGYSCYSEKRFGPGDSFVFGSEQHGLPEKIMQSVLPEQRLYLPMRGSSRSLNLSNVVSVVLYEAWRQNRFLGSNKD